MKFDSETIKVPIPEERFNLFRRGLFALDAKESVVRKSREFAEEADFIIRDIPGYIEIGFPGNVARYIFDHEQDYLQNQLIYSKETAHDKTEDTMKVSWCTSIIKLLSLAVCDLSDKLFDKNLSAKDLIQLTLTSLSFPHRSPFPLFSFTSESSSLQWGITFALSKTEFTQVVPILIVPHYGNAVVVVVPDPLSQASGILFKPLEDFKNATDSCAKRNKELEEKMNELDTENVTIYMESAIQVFVKYDFALIPPNPGTNLRSPLFVTLLQIIQYALLQPALSALTLTDMNDYVSSVVNTACTLVDKSTATYTNLARAWI